MKICLFLFVAILAAVCAHKVEDELNLNSDERNQVTAIEEKCLKETNAKVEEVHAFDKGQFAENKPLKCFYRCLLTNFGVMDEQGRVVMSKINLLVPEKHRTKAEHCFNVEKGEPCDVAYDLYKCYIESVHQPKA